MSVNEWLPDADSDSPWHQATVVVAGLGRSGFAAADALLERRAKVTVLDDSDSEENQDKAKLLRILGAEVTIGPGSTAALPDTVDLVVTSPGWRPTWPLLAQAAARGIPIWGETELAWRFMSPHKVVPWLAITGTNGKTTTTQMLESMLSAAGLSVACVGNIGRPVMEAINDEVAYDVFAVELSSFQLHWSPSLRMHSAAVLNVHDDHLEWYAHEDDPAAAYAADKARIFHMVTHACVYNVADPASEQMVAEADVVEGARAIGFTLGVPGPSMMGVVDDLRPDQRGGLAVGGLEVADQVAQRLGVGLGDVPGPDRVRVGRGDLAVDRVGDHLGGDLALELGGVRVAAEGLDDVVGQLARLRHQVGVRRDPLGREESTLVGLGGVGVAGGHEEPRRRGVLRRRLPGDERRGRGGQQQHHDHDAPTPADRAPVVAEVHAHPVLNDSRETRISVYPNRPVGPAPSATASTTSWSGLDVRQDRPDNRMVPRKDHPPRWS